MKKRRRTTRSRWVVKAGNGRKMTGLYFTSNEACSAFRRVMYQRGKKAKFKPTMRPWGYWHEKGYRCVEVEQ